MLDVEGHSPLTEHQTQSMKTSRLLIVCFMAVAAVPFMMYALAFLFLAIMPGEGAADSVGEMLAIAVMNLVFGAAIMWAALKLAR